MKKFYRAKLVQEVPGMFVRYDEYISIHESSCMHFCVSSFYVDKPLSLKDAKDRGYKVRRIHKDISRFAFDTKEKALDNLRYRKRRQIMHLKRELAFAEFFLNAELSDKEHGYLVEVKKSYDLVHSYLTFD